VAQALQVFRVLGTARGALDQGAAALGDATKEFPEEAGVHPVSPKLTAAAASA
jgi:hypothetical protein